MKSNKKEIKDELKESVELLQTIVDGLALGFALCELIFDEEGIPVDYRFLKVNAAFEKQTELTIKSIVGKTIKEIFPDIEQSWIDRFGSVVINKKPIQFIDYNHNTDKYYRVNAYSSSENKFAIVFEDITKERKLEENLQQREHSLSESERIGNTGSWEYDVATGTTTWSENMFRLFDIDPKMPANLVFEHFVDNLVHPDDKTKVLSAFEDAISGVREYNLDYRIIKKDGNLRYIHTITETILDENNKTICVIGKVEDITQRKEAEQKLIIANEKIEESEERFKLAMKASNDGLFDWNLETNDIYYSPGWKIMLGYEDHELTNDLSVWEERTDKEGINNFWELQQKLISRQVDRFVLEFKMRHKNGHWVDILSRAEAIFNGSGKAIRIVGTHTDITERKLAEIKLRDNQNYLSAVFNNTKDSQILVKYEGNKNFKTLAVNHSYIKRVNDLGLQITDKDLIGKSLKELAMGVLFLSQEVYDYTVNFYQKAIDTHEQVKVTESIVIEGNPYHSETTYTLVFNSEDGMSYILYNSHDITTETETILLLQKSEERFALAVNGSNDAIWDWDNLESDEFWWSDRLYRMLGYKHGEVEARMSNWKKWMHPDDSDLAMEILKKHFEKKLPYQVEFRMKKKNGNYVWLFARGESVRDKDGNPIRMAGSLSDITERKKTELLVQEQTEEIETQNEELYQANMELVLAKEHAEESDRLKSAFLANMSHEIRTPMNGILGFSDLLKEPGLTGDQQKEYIDMIEKGGTRMLNIINDIIDISKIEAGLMKTDIKESNVNDQIEYIYTFFKPEVKAKGIELIFNNTLPSKEAIISTDREKVFAILTNLVKNAVKYTIKGSIEFGYIKKGGNLEFYVKDTGIGIPKDRMGAIFERFIQADIADRMARQGVGLGLSITKTYIEMLGGNIWVESEESLGSIFYFTLPYHIEAEEKIIINNEVALDKAGNNVTAEVLGLKILIVEDDEISDSLITIAVEKFSGEIIKATTGLEAIEACRNNPDIDLILMDIKMPEMDGYEATKQIRQFNKDVIVIAQTAYVLTSDREKALESGCNDYIAKPINKNTLLALVQKYFKK